MIFLIRHGESQQNIDDVLSGITDVPLSDRGKQQCATLARYFENFQVDKVFVTPLQRAIDSADIIFPKHKSSIEIIESLIEFNYGEYEGYSRENYENSNDSIIQQWITSPSNLTFPGGDNIQAHAHRSLSSIAKLARENEGKVIACISHRTTIRLILAQIIGLHLDNFRSLPCSNCGISEITLNDQGDWQLHSLNVTPKYLPQQ